VDPASEIMTANELAAFLKVSRRTVYKLMKSKELPGFRVGWDYKFRRSDIDQWMRRPVKKP
jgi:excisionase family DNA binding protein